MTGVFEGVGTLQFSPDNKRCYAYSGTFPADGASHVVIEFTTSSEYIIGIIKINGALNPLTSSVANSNGEIKFNDITIGAGPMNTALDKPFYYYEKVNIPPFTNVKILINFHETDSNDVATALFTGKLYGAIEQENLEAITDNNKWASK